MSLVNDMLRDLEQRSARASEPLAGMRPAARAARTTSSRRIVLAGLFVLVAGAALFGIQRHNAVVAMPVMVVEPAGQPAAAVAAAPGAPAVAALRRYRLDYRLSDTPAPRVSKTGRPANPPAAQSDRVTEAAGRTRGAGTGIDRATQVDPAGNDPGRTRVIRTRVDPAVRLRGAGLAALQAGRGADAARHFRELIALDPSQTGPHLLLHRALVAQSRPVEAQAVLTAALEVSDQPARIAFMLAHSLLESGDGDAAQALLERYGGGADLDYVALLAAVYERNGEYERAADRYVYLVSQRPGEGTWWIGLAIASDALGRHSQARQAYERAGRSRGLDPALARYATERLRSMDAVQ